MIRRILPSLGILLLLILLPLLLFAPVALGGKTLVPADTLLLYEPYRTAFLDRQEGFPQNHLLGDLMLENYAWKHLLVQALRTHELPLWDPYTFAGHPFLANGQHSGLYPLSLVFYVLPLWRAYGVFVWLQLGLAGVSMYLLARVLGARRLGGLIAGITFQFSGFMIVSVVHPMIIAAASWLPFILAMTELVVQQRAAFGRPATLPWALLGAMALGCQMLAGHAENTYFVALVTGAYAVWRLVIQAATSRSRIGWGQSWLVTWRRPALWLVVMAILGLALGAVQFVPLYEAVAGSFRGGEAAASLQEVLGWAYPWRRLITFAIPNFFGNPAHHGYSDLFTKRWTPGLSFDDGQYVDWGIKNYVEGGAYLGLLPLFLACLAVLSHGRTSGSAGHLDNNSAGPPGGATASLCADKPLTRSTSESEDLRVGELSGGLCGRLVAWLRRPYVPFFTLLAVFSLGCVFGTRLYALVYALPLLRQSHSPFRWVFPLTLSIAVLAGRGVETIDRSRSRLRGSLEQGKRGASPVCGPSPRLSTHWFRVRAHLLLQTHPSSVSLLGGLAFWGGLLVLAGLGLSRVFFIQFEPLIERAFLSLAKAPGAFPDHRGFYSYEFRWVVLFGLLLTGTGIVLRVSHCFITLRRRPVWEALAVVLLLADMISFGAGFNPAVSPALLDYTPSVVTFLKQDTSVWRYATFTPPGTTKTMNANVGMLYGMQTVAGYDSLFARQYADYMGLIENQDQLQYNRIASFREWASLDSPLTDSLNVKYIITEVDIPNPKFRMVYQDDAVRVFLNLGAMPRAYTLPITASLATENLATTVQDYDPRVYVILDDQNDLPDPSPPQPGTATAQQVIGYSLNEVEIIVRVDQASWLVLADAHAPGWRAFVRPQGAGKDAETPVEIHRVNGVFRGVLVDPGGWTVRFKYSPDSVKVGAFVSFIAGMTVIFLAGFFMWRFLYHEQDDDSTVRRVAKNSLAPIIINLFNRSIEMAFAALMARILGPTGNGRYATAINIYLWFDVIANFGLDMFLIREVARDRDRARQVFVNTTILRLFLFAATAPLLGGFLTGRQAVGEPLARETVWAVVLLYAALLPGSLANGLAALFRGCERHEIPAAIQTVTTIVKVTLGVLALAGGMGIVGLAGASVLTNSATLAILMLSGRRIVWSELPPGRDRLVWPAVRAMLSASWPLMVSLLLQSLFAGVNVLLLQQLRGDQAVGWYDAGRKWVDALNIVPSFFTFAVFPVMSRQATRAKSRLRKSYGLSIKLLTIVALPAAVLITLASTVLVRVLSGSEFLPHGAVVLQILIWSIVFGWLNSLTNYVLIALDRQRYVLVASGLRVAFTVVANLLLVPALGHVASALIIIAGELLLILLFYIDLRNQLGSVQWGMTLGRPALAASVMGLTALAVAPISLPLALVMSSILYVLALGVMRVLSPEELDILSPLLPSALRVVIGGRASR